MAEQRRSQGSGARCARPPDRGPARPLLARRLAAGPRVEARRPRLCPAQRRWAAPRAAPVRRGRPEASRRPASRAPSRQARYDGPRAPRGDHRSGARPFGRRAAEGPAREAGARVARHLAAAGMLMDDDPETAYQHTLAARARAPRLAVVREATGEAAYAAGHYAEALSELRAAKRMNGATAYLPIMADCHRALGHPEQALKLAKSPSVVNFAPEAKAEMTLVEAGARRDLGQLDAALRTLELAPLNSKSRAAVGRAAALRLRRHAQAAGREQRGARLVPPDRRDRLRRDHRRGRACGLEKRQAETQRLGVTPSGHWLDPQVPGEPRPPAAARSTAIQP